LIAVTLLIKATLSCPNKGVWYPLSMLYPALSPSHFKVAENGHPARRAQPGGRGRDVPEW
jgi:hypothetical protein